MMSFVDVEGAGAADAPPRARLVGPSNWPRADERFSLQSGARRRGGDVLRGAPRACSSWRRRQCPARGAPPSRPPQEPRAQEPRDVLQRRGGAARALDRLLDALQLSTDSGGDGVLWQRVGPRHRGRQAAPRPPRVGDVRRGVALVARRQTAEESCCAAWATTAPRHLHAAKALPFLPAAPLPRAARHAAAAAPRRRGGTSRHVELRRVARAMGGGPSGLKRLARQQAPAADTAGAAVAAGSLGWCRRPTTRRWRMWRRRRRRRLPGGSGGREAAPPPEEEAPAPAEARLPEAPAARRRRRRRGGGRRARRRLGLGTRAAARRGGDRVHRRIGATADGAAAERYERQRCGRNCRRGGLLLVVAARRNPRARVAVAAERQSPRRRRSKCRRCRRRCSRRARRALRPRRSSRDSSWRTRAERQPAADAEEEPPPPPTAPRRRPTLPTTTLRTGACGRLRQARSRGCVARDGECLRLGRAASVLAPARPPHQRFGGGGDGGWAERRWRRCGRRRRRLGLALPSRRSRRARGRR